MCGIKNLKVKVVAMNTTEFSSMGERLKKVCVMGERVKDVYVMRYMKEVYVMGEKLKKVCVMGER